MSAGQLSDITADIVKAHRTATGALRDAVACAVRAGELLLQAKAAMPHGSFGEFCASLPFAATTARGYMRLAALDPAKRQRIADLPLRVALQELAESRGAVARAIPLGSVGLIMWRDATDTVRFLEVHPACGPDGTSVGLHYALATATAAGTVTCDASRHAAKTSVEELAKAFHAPLDSMRVSQGEPVFWAPEVPS